MLYTGSHRYQFAKDMYFSSLPLQQSYAHVVPKYIPSAMRLAIRSGIN